MTGNLQCWVFYPRFQRFGAKFETNVTKELQATKNAEYLLVTGDANIPQAAGNVRPAACIVYVVDTKSGEFAAYGVPWNRASESSGEPQRGPLMFIAGDRFRTPTGGATAKKSTLPSKDATKDNKAPTK